MAKKLTQKEKNIIRDFLGKQMKEARKRIKGYAKNISNPALSEFIKTNNGLLIDYENHLLIEYRRLRLSLKKPAKKSTKKKHVIKRKKK